MASRKVGDWIEAFLRYTENTEPPLLYRKWTAISTIAAVLQRKCYLEWGTMGKVYPNMYVVLVGPSGARKTTAMKMGLNFLEELGIRISSDSITREALIQELERVNEMDPLTGEMHSSLTVFSPELAVFLKKDDADFMAILADWFDCAKVWRYSTKTKGNNEIVGVWFNIMGATTPHLIRTHLPLDAVGGGLASRIIFVYASRKGKVVPLPFLENQDTTLPANLLFDLNLIHGLKGAFKTDAGFRERYSQWYLAEEGNNKFQGSTLFDGYSSRRPTHLFKICMILSASQGSKMLLDRAILDRGLEILTEVEGPMERTFIGMASAPREQLLQTVMEFFLVAKSSSKSALITHFRYEINDLSHLDSVLDVLLNMGFLKADRDRTTGKPKAYILDETFVRTKLGDGWSET